MELYRAYLLVILSQTHLLFTDAEDVDEVREQITSSIDGGDFKALTVERKEDKIEYCYDWLSENGKTSSVPKQPVRTQAVFAPPQSLWWYIGNSEIFESYRRKLWRRRGLVMRNEGTKKSEDQERSLETLKGHGGSLWDMEE